MICTSGTIFNVRQRQWRVRAVLYLRVVDALLRNLICEGGQTKELKISGKWLSVLYRKHDSGSPTYMCVSQSHRIYFSTVAVR